MSNIEKLREAFSQALNIDLGRVNDEISYNSIPEWDSIAHMSLVAEIEIIFEIMLDTDDIVDMSSFEKTKTILTKYKINF